LAQEKICIMSDYTKIKLRDGTLIPTVAFGTGTSYFDRVDDVCEGILKAVKIGYRWFDTAVMYGTERGVGKGLAKVKEQNLCKREELFITTKISPNTWKFQEVNLFIIVFLISYSLTY
jgi:diketogulonate reductase-like aldo/keto reductase